MSLALPEIPTDDPRWTKEGVIHVPNGSGDTRWVAGDVYTVKVSRADTNGALSVIEASVPPGAGPVAHVHAEHDEAFYLLAGELEFLNGSRTFVARAGDLVYVPRGIRHRFKNMGVHPARMLFLFTPAGPEKAFEVIGEPAEPGIQTPPSALLSEDQLAAVLQVSAEINTALMPEPL